MEYEYRITSLKIPSGLHRKVMQQVIADGYGMRGKSKWVIESINIFLDLPDYEEFVNIATEMENFGDIISIRLPMDVSRKVDDAIVKVRKKFPAMEGVRSTIIRASLWQRLIGNK